VRLKGIFYNFLLADCFVSVKVLFCCSIRDWLFMPGLLASLHAVSVADVGDFREQKGAGMMKPCARAFAENLLFYN